MGDLASDLAKKRQTDKNRQRHGESLDTIPKKHISHNLSDVGSNFPESERLLETSTSVIPFNPQKMRQKLS